MKGNILNIILTIIGTIISGFIVYEITQEEVELKFYLTESIPLKVNGSEVIESVQQLTIVNSGEVAIESIGVKINTKVQEVSLIKNFVDDNVTHNESGNFFQAKYPKLPPNAKFSYIIKSTIEGLSNSDIDISHSKGKAINGFAPSDNSNLIFSIYIAMIVLLLVYLVHSVLKSQRLGDLNYDSYYDAITLLNKPRPFYINQKDWDLARVDFIKTKKNISSFYSANLQDSEAFKVLNSKQPEHISDTEWDLLVNIMKEVFDTRFTYRVNVSTSYEKVSDLFLIPKPKLLSDLLWQELQKKLIEKLFDIDGLSNSSSELPPNYRTLGGRLYKPKPRNISNENWKKYITALTNKYFNLIILDIVTKGHRVKFIDLGDYDLKQLTPNQVQTIKNFEYNLKLSEFRGIKTQWDAEEFLSKKENSWMNEEHYQQYETIANRFMELTKSEEESSELLRTLEYLISGIKLGEKPPIFNSDTWQKLTKIEGSILTKKNENIEFEQKLAKDQLELEALKAKVLNQLEIISKLLENPKSILEVEDYNIPFAKGNFENLVTLSNHLTELN